MSIIFTPGFSLFPPETFVPRIPIRPVEIAALIHRFYTHPVYFVLVK